MTGSLPLLVAVDGGNSKTDLVVLEPHGRERVRATGPGSGGGPAALARVVASLLDENGFDPDRVTQVAAAAAGLDFPDDEVAFRLALEGLLPSAAVDVFNDAVAVLDAGAGLGDALAVVSGAGLNAVARGDRGLASVPALGWPSGDWGGGDEVGREAVRTAYRAFDGRGPRTVLGPRILSVLGCVTFPELARAIRDGGIAPARIGMLSAVVTRAAADGDAPARAIVERAAHEAVLLAGEVAGRAWSSDAPQGTPAVLAGGMFGDPGFRAVVADALTERGFTPAPLAFPPIDGVVRAVVAAAAAAAQHPAPNRKDPV